MLNQRRVVISPALALTEPAAILQQAQAQAASVADFQIPFYVLTTVAVADTETIHFVQVPAPSHPWWAVMELIQAHPEWDAMAVTDLADVTLRSDPFDLLDAKKLYIGDQTQHLFEATLPMPTDSWQMMRDFIWQNGHLLTLNAGVLLGSRAVILEFFGQALRLITDEQRRRRQAKLEPLALKRYQPLVVNYVAQRYFGQRLVHGRQVTTLYGEHQLHSSAWFKHK
jgi:hypothetical protein